MTARFRFQFSSAARLMAAGTLVFAPQSTLKAQDAQTPPAPPTESPAPNPAMARVTQTMSDAVAAYGTLKSYSGRFALSGTPANTAPNEKGTLSFTRPNRVAMRIEGNGYARRIVSDGKFIYMSDSRIKGKYLKRPLPPGGDATGRMIAGLSGGSLLMTALLAGENPIQGRAQAAVVSALDAPVLSLEVGGGQASATPKMRLDFTFDPTDKLLRNLNYNISGPQAVRVEETHSEVQSNPDLPASTWVFTPSAGAKAVDSLEPPTWDERLKLGAKPFAIKSADWKGKAVSLDSYKGKVLLIDFWATWCPPCREEMPNIISAYKRHQKSGFDILGVSLDQDKSALTQYVASNKMPWRQLFDGKGWGNAIAGAYGVKAIPFSLLIGRDGKIAAVNPRGAELEPAIRAALKK